MSVDKRGGKPGKFWCNDYRVSLIAHGFRSRLSTRSWHWNQLETSVTMTGLCCKVTRVAFLRMSPSLVSHLHKVDTCMWILMCGDLERCNCRRQRQVPRRCPSGLQQKARIGMAMALVSPLVLCPLWAIRNVIHLRRMQ